MRKQTKSPDSLLPWAQPGWLDDVSEWLLAQGVQLCGPLVQFYARPWALVYRVPTSDGTLYFKATAPRFCYEVAVSLALAHWTPRAVLPVIAADPQRGWLLLPPGGTTLREMIRGSGEYRLWLDVLPAYAQLQQSLAGRVPQLLDMGTPDRRLVALPALYEELLEDRELLCVDQEGGLSLEQYRELKELSPRVAEWCAELASYAVPETLQHGDLTDGNVFMAERVPEFFDWGDSSVSHPFYSLRVAFTSLYFSLGIDTGAPELDMLRDSYLEAWTDYETRTRLRMAYDLANRLAFLEGALKWQRAVEPLEGAERAEYAAPVPSLLGELLAEEGL